MTKIIDFKTGKELKKDTSEQTLNYIERIKLCSERAKITLDDKCDCVYCSHKEALARKLVTISQWLVVDHCEKNDLDLCWADWFDITVTAADKVKDVVYPNLKQ